MKLKCDRIADWSILRASEDINLATDIADVVHGLEGSHMVGDLSLPVRSLALVRTRGQGVDNFPELFWDLEIAVVDRIGERRRLRLLRIIDLAAVILLLVIACDVH